MAAVFKIQRTQQATQRSTKKMNLGEMSPRCTPIDYTWFEFTKLLSGPSIAEEDLVAGAARLVPAFCHDPQGTCASISLGSEECHYSSDNFPSPRGNSSSWRESVEIPSSVEGAPCIGSIHIFHLRPPVQSIGSQLTSSRSNSLDSAHTTESCTSRRSYSDNLNDTTTNETAPKGRILLVAQLLGQALSHRRSQDERCRFFEDSNDLHAVLVASGNGENVQLNLSEINPAWMRELGWSREDLVGQTINGVVHPQDTSSLKQFLITHADDESSQESRISSEQGFGNPDLPFVNKYFFENRIRAADGTYHWICWSVVGTDDPNTGTPSSGADMQQQQQQRRILITGRDFTARKRAETALWESQRRLRESQKIARLGQWELDLPNNELYWSDEIYRLFRVDKDRFGASYEAFLNAIHPDDRDMVNTAYTTSLETKEPYSITHRLCSEDGSIKWVNELCRTEYDEAGKPLRSIGTVQDITELRQAQEGFRLAKERAEEADRLKSAFLANMSHEIRTPMNAVIGYTDLMLMDYDALSENHREFLEIIKSSGKLLLTLINDILDVSKIEAGQMRLEHSAFSLRGTLRTVACNAMGLLSRKGKGKIALKGPTGLFQSEEQSRISDFVMGDSARIQQVLNNLISNAIKFTNHGTVEYGAWLVDGPKSKMIEFFVKDTGIGISPEDQRLVFEPFRQTHGSAESHELGGTGLGLAIARKLVVLMGGGISLESKVGGDDHGSTFRFTIPYIPGSENLELGQGSQAEMQVDSPSPPSEKLTGKILLVDDSKVNLKLAERVIVKMGCSSITAKNGKVAVTIFERDPSINLILMDKEMPQMDGLAATREIRKIEAREKRKAIPIIALTAAAMSGDREECMAAGCNDYLPKPLDREKLHHMLTKFL